MGKNMKRAPMMMAIAATLALGALAAPAQAQTEIKIGFINSYSGFLAQPGDQMDKGVDALQASSMRRTCRPASPSSSSSATTPRRRKSPSASRKN